MYQKSSYSKATDDDFGNIGYGKPTKKRIIVQKVIQLVGSYSKATDNSLL